MAAANADIVIAYRKLYRGLLHAVQYSKPARYVARDMLRDAFRKEEPSSFDVKRVENTVKFLEVAARETGIEHKIIKNRLHVRWREREDAKVGRRRGGHLVSDHVEDARVIARAQYASTITMLNETAGLCLR